MLQAAITETVKKITNMTDIVVTLKDGPYTTDHYVATKQDSIYKLYVTLRESKSLVALNLLRDATKYYGFCPYAKDSETIFSCTMSMKLDYPLYALISDWFLMEITQQTTSEPSPSSKPTSAPSSLPSKIGSKPKVISLISAHLQSS